MRKQRYYLTFTIIIYVGKPDFSIIHTIYNKYNLWI